MGSKGFCIPEEGHFAQLIAVGDDMDGADTHYPVVNMEYWSHVDFFICLGTSPRVAAVITVESCSNWVTLAGAPTTATKIAFDYYTQGTVAAPTIQTTSGNDIMSVRTAQATAATGIVPVAGVDNIVYVISLDDTQLIEDHIGFRLDVVNAAAACVSFVFAICSGGRYQGAVQESVTKA